MSDMTLQEAFNLAIEQHQAGRWREAEGLYRRILAQEPDHPAVLHMLGVLGAQLGKMDGAIRLFECAIQLKPDEAGYHSSLAEGYRRLQRLDEAIAAARRAIDLDPNLPEAWNGLAGALGQKGRSEEAIAAATRAIELKPDFSFAYNNLGNALGNAGRTPEAIAAFEHALQLRPDAPDIISNLGNMYSELGRVEDALAAYRRSIELRPGFADPHNNIGNLLKDNGRVDEALANYRKAIELQPNFADAHWNYAYALLLVGDYQRGWDEAEWRWRLPKPPRSRNYGHPLWNGSDLTGKTILLYAEQGLGDAIQFVRYVPMVAERGGRIVLECAPDLHRLVESMPQVAQVVEFGDPLPHFNVRCPLLTLPKVFGTRVDTIPAQVPYLHPPQALIDQWGERLAPHIGAINIGLFWEGSLTRRTDPRSLPLSRLAPLASAQGVTFHSLFKHKPDRPAPETPPGMNLVDWETQLTDFAETAALMSHLDLIITIDTSVAHLAGALGKETWLMLHFAADWRWLLDRDDSPWYPTARLFRQPAPGDWEPVIQQVTTELRGRLIEFG